MGAGAVDKRSDLERGPEAPSDHLSPARGVGGLPGNDINQADPLAGNRMDHHVPVLAQEPDRDAAGSLTHDWRPQGGQADCSRRGDDYRGEPVHVREADRHEVGQLQQRLIESLAHGRGGKAATASR